MPIILKYKNTFCNVLNKILFFFKKKMYLIYQNMLVTGVIILWVKNVNVKHVPIIKMLFY